MYRMSFLATVCWACGVISVVGQSFAFVQQPTQQTVRNDDLAELQRWADKAHQESKVPAVFAGVVRGDAAPLIVASGVRKVGDPTPVTAGDFIHIGSCTKALTALMMARLVDQGILDWDQPLEKLAPELSKKINPYYAAVTLRQLLSHRGGVPANAKNWWLSSQTKDILRVRTLIARDSLKEAAKDPLGAKYLYSNLGYMLASLVAAEVTQKSWEDLIRAEVFEPLQLNSAGFGPPGKKGAVEQPWGHTFASDWKPNQTDNAPALGPAGTLHISGGDWAKMAQYFIRGADSDYLSATQYEQLLAVQGDQYALGWGVTERPWAEGLALNHSGSNTSWFCTIWIAPKIQRAYFVATNGVKDNTPEVCDQWIGQLIRWDSK